jgi:hypothetical protein
MTQHQAITKAKFLAYEKVRRSGKTNMMNIKHVITLAKDVLTPDECKEIIKNYEHYADKYQPKRSPADNKAA